MGVVARGSVLALLVVAAGWQSAPPAASFDSEGVPIRYLDQGNGEAVLLLNGFGRTLGQWPAAIVSRLVHEGFRVVTYDTRGVGGSGKPAQPGQYGQEDVNDAERLLRHLSIDRVHLLGYSRGASIASRLAVQRPAFVRSAILGGWAVGNPVDALSAPECAVAAQELTDGQTPTALVRALTPVGTPLPPVPPPPAQLPPIENRKALAAAFLGDCQSRRVTTVELQKTKLPMLALVGEQDGMAASAKAMAQQVSNLKLIVIPKADHVTAFGDQFVDEAIRFLKSQRPSLPRSPQSH